MGMIGVPMENLSYLLELGSKHVDPRTVNVELLQQWAMMEYKHGKRVMSAYQLWAYLGKPIAKNNFRENIKHLAKQRLLKGLTAKEVKELEIHNTRKAIYYSISDFGWFTIMANGWIKYPSFQACFFKHHKDSSIFKWLVSPFFDNEDSVSPNQMANYLKDCCSQVPIINNEVDEAISALRKRPEDWKKQEGITKEILSDDKAHEIKLNRLRLEIIQGVTRIAVDVCNSNFGVLEKHRLPAVMALREDIKFQTAMQKVKEVYDLTFNAITNDNPSVHTD